MRNDIVSNKLNTLTIEQACKLLSESDNLHVKASIRTKLQIIYGKLISTLKAGMRELNDPKRAKRWDRDAKDGLWRVQEDARAVARSLGIPFGYAMPYPK